MAKVKTAYGYKSSGEYAIKFSRFFNLAVIDPDDTYVALGDNVMDAQTLFPLQDKSINGMAGLNGKQSHLPHGHALLTTTPTAHTELSSPSPTGYQLAINLYDKGNNSYRCVLDKSDRQKGGAAISFQDQAGQPHLLVTATHRGSTNYLSVNTIILIEGNSITDAVNTAVLPTPPAHPDSTSYLVSSCLNVLKVDTDNKVIYFLANFYRPSNTTYYYFSKNDLYKATFTTNAVDGSLSLGTPTRCSVIDVGFTGGSTYVESQPRFYCGKNNAGKPCFLTIQENNFSLNVNGLNAYTDADPYGGDAGYWRSSFLSKCFYHAFDIYELPSNSITRVASLSLTSTGVTSPGSRFGGHRQPTHFEPSPIAGETDIYYSYTLVFSQDGNTINFVRFKWDKANDTFQTDLLSGLNLKSVWVDSFSTATTATINTLMLTNDGNGGLFISVLVQHYNAATLGVAPTNATNMVVYEIDPTDMQTMTLKQNFSFPCLRVVGLNENNTRLAAIFSGSAKTYSWTNNGWVLGSSFGGNYLGLGEDHNGVLWGVSASDTNITDASYLYNFAPSTSAFNISLEYLSDNLPNSVRVEFVDPTIAYAGVTLTKNLRVNAYDPSGNRVAKDCEIKLSSSNAVFTSNNASVLGVTTSAVEDTLVSLTIDGPGFINVSASFVV